MYSQDEEERFILEACSGHFDSPPQFLDIGGWNAKDKSNTRALFELGWKGVIIEPSPVPFASLLEEYGNEPRITLICAAVAIEKGMAKIHASADAVSTTSEKNYERWKTDAKFTGTFWIPTITIDDIHNQFGGFAMVSIDTEGTSVDLLRELLVGGARPKCICVEHDNRHSEIARLTQKAGYTRTYESVNNEVWVTK